MSTRLPGQVPEHKRRPEPQSEVPGRAPRCPECQYLEDALGHFWAHLAPGGWLRKPWRRVKALPETEGAA